MYTRIYTHMRRYQCMLMCFMFIKSEKKPQVIKLCIFLIYAISFLLNIALTEFASVSEILDHFAKGQLSFNFQDLVCDTL